MQLRIAAEEITLKAGTAQNDNCRVFGRFYGPRSFHPAGQKFANVRPCVYACVRTCPFFTLKHLSAAECVNVRGRTHSQERSL